MRNFRKKRDTGRAFAVFLTTLVYIYGLCFCGAKKQAAMKNRGLPGVFEWGFYSCFQHYALPRVKFLMILSQSEDDGIHRLDARRDGDAVARGGEVNIGEAAVLHKLLDRRGKLINHEIKLLEGVEADVPYTDEEAAVVKISGTHQHFDVTGIVNGEIARVGEEL